MCLEAAGDASFLLAKCAGKKTASLFCAAAAPVVQEHAVILPMS